MSHASEICMLATELVEERDRYREALREIINVIGPEPANCGCEGCHAEVYEAVRLARAAVGGRPGMSHASEICKLATELAEERDRYREALERIAAYQFDGTQRELARSALVVGGDPE